MCHFEFDSQNQILRARFDGRVTDEELMAFYGLATEHVARILPCVGITDFSAVASFEVSHGAIRTLADAPPVMPNLRSPRFIVAPTDQIFELACLFALYGERTRENLYVVRIPEAVWAILSISEPHFERVQSALR
jgi:hypothetical protein